jgi:hypothetical protein
MDRSGMRNSPVADVGAAHGTSPHGRVETSKVVGRRVSRRAHGGIRFPLDGRLTDVVGAFERMDP